MNLLEPRYKVIAKVPLSRHKVGDIIYGDGDWYSTHRSHVDVSCSAFPDVYRPLEWWEEREEKDMPQYVKITKDTKGLLSIDKFGQTWKAGKIHKVMQWDVNIPYLTKNEFVLACFTEPATEEEYNNQKS